MNIFVAVSFLVFSLVITAKGDLKPSENYLKGMFRHLAKEKCTTSCKEKLSSCKEFRNQMSVCESMNELVHERTYNAGVSDCERSVPAEDPLVCSFDSIRSTYRMEGVGIPENYLYEFVDSLSENV